MAQILISGLIVIGAAGYSAWALMPRAWQQRLARALLGREGRAPSGCGACADCPSGQAAAAPAQVIQIHRRAAYASAQDRSASR